MGRRSFLKGGIFISNIDVIQTITESILSKMKLLVDQKVNCDKTFTAKVTEVISPGKCRVLYSGNDYTISTAIPVRPGDVVRVCAPCNNWKELFITENKSLAHIYHDLGGKVNSSGHLANGTDFNKIIISGFYRFNSNENHLNAPPISWGQMLVIQGGGDTIAQLAFAFETAASFYLRTGNPPECGGVGQWQPWHRYVGTIT